MNISVITDSDNNSTLSLSSLTRSAYADGEGGGGPFYMEVCRTCYIPEYGQTGMQFACYATGDGTKWYCESTPCGYGYC